MEQPWYKKWWGIILAVLFFPFFIIWYAWAKSNWSKNMKIGVTVGSIILIVLALITSSSNSSKYSSPTSTAQPTKQIEQNTPKPKAKYQGSIATYKAINPATLQFVANVKNIGNTEGKFNCTVSAKDASSTYTGFDFFEDQGGILKPGETRTFNGILTIKKEGAAFVTDVSIKC
jgi:hypothetical protein